MTLETKEYTDVLIVGAGPAGLMLGVVLARLGVKFKIIDDRPSETSSGRADGIQPKTLETFKQLGLLEQIESQGVKIFDITFWNPSTDGSDLVRTGREDHFPSVVDLRDPYILLLHQGIVEKAFTNDLKLRDFEVERNQKFISYSINDSNAYQVQSEIVDSTNGQHFVTSSKYIVGCDGTRSAVRASMPNSQVNADTTDLRWAVIDGVLNTDFPDFWSKTVIRSQNNGTILGIPRERGLTRLYIELPGDFEHEDLVTAQPVIMEKARNIISPFKLEWDIVEWFSIYRVRQGVTTSFIDRSRAFILGDASHTHSANAAQGMNVSMHDSWNLGWKLALVIKNIGSPRLLETYEQERMKVAHDLINFDKVHTKAFKKGDPVELAKNFEQNVKFISGIGAEYDMNLLNKSSDNELLVPGTLPPPVDAHRYVDANPVHMETDVPTLGQFKLYFAAKDFKMSEKFLQKFSEKVQKSPFLNLYRIAKLDSNQIKLEKDLINHKRYTPISQLFTVCLVTESSKKEIELNELPDFFKPYKWTVYLDDQEERGPFQKWFPNSTDSVSLLILRPDGYIGASKSFGIDSDAVDAVEWLHNYFSPLLV
ncbi:hypothetical protein WICANDRAFT_85406 [Wickerhamomyces anomalus NRRL Y-366-8]|uniref:FAD-binding domain-containing protein n=1 Tax=Wickerhamomyces anomalus (strain ATCC 58044 / CBS 1984 / NCYC 433 / NRRL Y-366-8) TaxID=683960 RepID=A0A1E3P0D8_WICAA|nr:uncharacterized protein WICANDRAFT_85406 [Wickerhamomyces anomalus NRRL Y-366-8]ODQ58347.1 hypothetical protein WICANDRAFT_85406 [Wickerhamomyces anomalus NRRL Y-366-8]